MRTAIVDWLATADGFAAGLIAVLAIIILVSGLDDLIVDGVWLFQCARWRRKRTKTPAVRALQPVAEPRIAIFVPLWHEYGVIAGMLEHNMAAIDYHDYDFFVGAYPNDDATLELVRRLESLHSRIHVALCPHDGPTSKADCLNWIYQRMLLYEETSRRRFDIVITHDAEDLIHPQALRELSRHAAEFDMVQIPVLPLPTPLQEVVHGAYCDEFAEYQLKDMVVRGAMGSFIPSCGVGTAYSRSALQRMAESSGNRIFEPVCLTEDYENGIRLHELGCRQIFLPVARSAKGFVATREYFPRTLRAAIRQRTRWVTGIALQSWERHGWTGTAGVVYWFWRDRKGLIGNPLSLLANLVFLYGVVSSSAAWWYGTYWALPYAIDARLTLGTLLLLAIRAGVRMACSTRIYGFVFALGVPARCICANYINATASILALFHFCQARLRRRPLVWLKTEHAYPSRSALLAYKRRLGEILTGSAYVSESDLERALARKPDDMRIGEYLVRAGLLTEAEVLEALSLQQGLPAGAIHPREVARNAARALPRQFVHNWHVVPFKIADGHMFLAIAEAPSDELTRELRGLTRLGLQFQLVTADNLEQLERAVA